MPDKHIHDLQLAKKWYGQSTNTTGTLLIVHVAEAAAIIEDAIAEAKEVPSPLAETLYRATLGHDLLEDTATAPATIAEGWGAKALRIIQELTNAKGDRDFSDYLTALEKSSEEVLLVKFADILANLNNTHERLAQIDPSWVKSFWLPLLRQYETRLVPRTFHQFPLTAARLTNKITSSIQLLEKKNG